MANQTDFLQLVLPANNEFNDTWDVPNNANFVAIDQVIESLSNELQSARFAKTTLAEFLQVSHNTDGTLRPSEEQDNARNSPIYGDDAGGQDFSLKDRLDRSDFELFYAREGLEDLRENLARRLADNDYLDRALEGPANNQGAPNFLSASGSEFQVNGDPNPIYMNIGGFLMRVESDENVQVSGADGTKYLVAQRPASPVVIKDRSTQTTGVTTQNALNNDKIQVIKDTGLDFEADGVRPGMILQILNTQNAGNYVIDQVNFDSESDQLLIIGRFSVAISGTNYRIVDPLKPVFSVETSYAPAKGKCYLGQGEFLAGSLTSALAYAFKGKYESNFQSVDVSSTPTFEVVLNHNLGFIPKKFQVMASQANDNSEPVEPLSSSVVGNDLSVAINDNLVFTPGQFSPGSTDASYTQGELNGSVTGTLSGGVFNLRSVLVKVTKTQIFIKNVRPNHFYRDYDQTDRQVGFLKAVCE